MTTIFSVPVFFETKGNLKSILRESLPGDGEGILREERRRALRIS